MLFFIQYFDIRKSATSNAALFLCSIHYPIYKQKLMDIIFTPFLFSIIAFQVDFFHLTHKRISWVSSCTLVVECLLCHIIQCIQEVFLIYTVIFDCLLNANLLFEFFQFSDEVLKYFFICLTFASCNVLILRILQVHVDTDTERMFPFL